MAKKKKKSQDAQAAANSQQSSTSKVSYTTWPVPRRFVVDPDEAHWRCKPGYLQFVSGENTDYTTQSIHWQKKWPDLRRPYYNEEEVKTALPQSWPPNFVLLAPEQQIAPRRAKPVHGGYTWPGHPKPPIGGFDYWLGGLPFPVKRFLYALLR